MLFVNSEGNASRILAKLKHDNWKLALGLARKSSTSVKRLHNGLVAIEFESRSYAQKAEKILKLLGGRPSNHEVGKLASLTRPPSAPSGQPRAKVDNGALFELFKEESHKVVTALGHLPHGHAMRAIAGCSASLINGLDKVLTSERSDPELKNTPLVANALNALVNTIRALPTTIEDSTLFFAGYAAMLEEMHLLLASFKPYTDTDFK